jgi:hypothetical protein
LEVLGMVTTHKICSWWGNCVACRNAARGVGEDMRLALYAAGVLSSVDADCPNGLPDGYTGPDRGKIQPIKPVTPRRPSQIALLLSRVESLAPAQDTSDRARMLRAVTAQLASLYGRLSGSCGCSAAKHRQRIIQKINWYVDEFCGVHEDVAVN